MEALDFTALHESISRDWKQSLLDKGCIKMVKNFYKNEKVKITHDYDPPYDHSGSKEYTNEKYKVEDYKIFEDFLNEYNGVSRPSYMSGCGLFWDTYENEIEEFFREEIYSYCRSIIAKLLNVDVNSDFISDYYDEFDNEIHDDFVFLIESDLMEMLEEIKKESFTDFLSKYTIKVILNTDNTNTPVNNLDSRV